MAPTQTAPKRSSSTPQIPAPKTTLDPRFKVARALVSNGQAEEAAEVFSRLLEQAVRAYGESNIEVAPLYHEYGNSLFRAYQREKYRQAEDEDVDASVEDKRSATAAAAEKRLLGGDGGSITTTGPQLDVKPASDTKAATAGTTKSASNSSKESDNEGSDLGLALELVETSWAIYDQALETSPDTYREWIQEQLPRALTHIGELLAEYNRYADSIDSFLRSLQHQEAHLEELTVKADKSVSESLELLQCRRKITENYMLVAETALECTDATALVTTETKTEIIAAGERVSFAQGYYQAAQSQFEETLVLMGHLAGKGVELGEEKENVCFASALLMGVGLKLSEIEESNVKPAAEPSSKKQKKT
jgi:hypothetical protein